MVSWTEVRWNQTLGCWEAVIVKERGGEGDVVVRDRDKVTVEAQVTKRLLAEAAEQNRKAPR
jgi:hypothetical protein